MELNDDQLRELGDAIAAGSGPYPLRGRKIAATAAMRAAADEPRWAAFHDARASGLRHDGDEGWSPSPETLQMLGAEAESIASEHDDPLEMGSLLVAGAAFQAALDEATHQGAEAGRSLNDVIAKEQGEST